MWFVSGTARGALGTTPGLNTGDRADGLTLDRLLFQVLGNLLGLVSPFLTGEGLGQLS